MTKINFTGNIDNLKEKIEQTIATYELLGNQTSINFDEWFEGWENGFPEDIENRALGNYPATGEKAWRGDASKKPRWRQWSNTNGFIKGEYWRDRSAENESIPLSGTADKIIQHIHQLEYEGGGESASRSKSKHWPPLKGQPEIKLYFRGEKRAEAETSFRIMNKTDDPKIPLSLIEKSDLKTYARKIKEQFATPNLFVWQKGKEILSYQNRWQGFDGQWWLCRNETAGRALLTKILAVADLALDTSKIRMSQATDEAAAFPVNPPDITVLGEVVRQDVERPLVEVAFWRAEIKLAKLPKPIALVERGSVVYD
ncbi:hypothetical protein QUA71_06965 [Microcoleus sp. MON1_C5]|uniref:hypothetical protein n=1 Tax=Microcoleus sp. MON1_C5 TaxID=2818828 RepID=UPI002FD651A4